MSSLSSLSVEEEHVHEIPLHVNASFGVLFAATVVSSWIVGSTYQWVVEKGLFRKDFFQKENQYNVLVGVSGLTANLQTIGCFWNALLAGQASTTDATSSFGLTIALGINMLFMTHSSLMLVSRKVSLTYPNAEQTWKRVLWIHLPLIPVSLLGATVWAISRHPDFLEKDSTTINWQRFQTILVALQISIWGLFEASLSALFCFQMWRYEWTEVERKGQAVLALIAACDIACIVVSVTIGDLQGLCLWGLVYSLRVRLEVRVMTAMIEFLQVKRSVQMYQGNSRRRQRRNNRHNNTSKPFSSLDDDDDISDAGSLASAASGRSIFSRIQIPHPNDLTQLFKANFFSDFLVSGKQSVSQKFSSIQFTLNSHKKRNRATQQSSLTICEKCCKRLPSDTDIVNEDELKSTGDNNPKIDDPDDPIAHPFPFGSFRFSGRSYRDFGNSLLFGNGGSAAGGDFCVCRRTESSMGASETSFHAPPIQELRLFSNALEAVHDEDISALAPAGQPEPGNNNSMMMRDDSYGAIVSGLDSSHVRNLDMSSRHSMDNSRRQRFRRALPVRGSGNAEGTEGEQGQTNDDQLNNNHHPDHHQEPFVIRFNGQVDKDNLSDLALSSQGSDDSSSSDEESLVDRDEDIENGLQQLGEGGQDEGNASTGMEHILVADQTTVLLYPRPPSPPVTEQKDEQRQQLQGSIIESHKAAECDTNNSIHHDIKHSTPLPIDQGADQAGPTLQSTDDEKLRSSAVPRPFRTSFKMVGDADDDDENEDLDESYRDQLNQLRLLQCI